MNVLFLDQFSELWGAQRCLADLLPAIEERGWRASAALPGHGPLVKLLAARGFDVHAIPCGPYRSGTKGITDGVRFLRDYRSQVAWLESQNYDLVYVNGPRLLPAAAQAFRGRAPVLFHAHSRIPAGLQAAAARWSIRRSNAVVVACARAVALDIEDARVQIIANGTPDMGFRERGFQRRRVGMIGRISPEKGQVEFLRAAALVVREFPDARFTICGAPVSTEDNYFRTVEKMADLLPVELLGWRDDIASVLAELDLLVIASKDEGMPRVMLEAFSAGVPVLAIPAGGIGEVIVDGATGFLTRENTVAGLADRIREVFGQGAGALGSVARNARRAWEKQYTVEMYRQRITDLMEDLVSDWRAEHGKESLQLRT